MPIRVFRTGSSVESVTEEARAYYGPIGYVIVKVVQDPKKRVPRSAKIRGKTKYYRIYLKRRER